MVGEIIKSASLDSMYFWRGASFLLFCIIVIIVPHFEQYRQMFKKKDKDIEELKKIIEENTKVLSKVNDILEQSSRESIIIDGEVFKLKELKKLKAFLKEKPTSSKDNVLDNYGDD